MRIKSEPNLFSQNIIALIFDFDKTLIPYNMQHPLFKRYKIDEDIFWKEVEALPEFLKKVNSPFNPLVGEVHYLNHFISYVNSGRMPDLSNDILREEAKNLEFYPGVLDIFSNLQNFIQSKDIFQEANISLEFYVISSGFRQMILGSQIAPFLKGAWGCEFLETTGFPGFLDLKGDYSSVERKKVITAISYLLDNTTKTRVLFEINKGSNIDKSINVNAKMSQEARRIPFENMIYIADGPSDIPVFSLLNDRKGKTFCVYNPNNDSEFSQARSLQDTNRVQCFGPADYTDNSHTYRWILHSLEQMARSIISSKKEKLARNITDPPKHLS